MTTKKLKVVAYIDDNAMSELKDISAHSGISRSRMLIHALDAMIYKARLLNREGLEVITKKIIESYGAKVSTGKNGEMIVRDIDDSEAFRVNIKGVKTVNEILKRLKDAQDEAIADLLRSKRQAAPIILAIPLIATDIKICCEQK